MDLYEIIQTLHEERRRLDRIIRRIQELQEPASGWKKTRALTPREKRELSKRLRPAAGRTAKPPG